MEVFTDQRLSCVPLLCLHALWLACITTFHAGLVYCIDYLDSNLDWLQEKLELIQTGRECHKLSGCHSVSNKMMCNHSYNHLCSI